MLSQLRPFQFSGGGRHLALARIGRCPSVRTAVYRHQVSHANASTKDSSSEKPFLPNSEAIGLSLEHLTALLGTSGVDGTSREVQENIHLLLQLQPSPQRVNTLLTHHPQLLTAPLNGWLQFFLAYGMPKGLLLRLLSKESDVFAQGCVFTAGEVMMYLRSLGLTPRDISFTLIPQCARLLMEEPSELAARVDFLTRLGLSQQEVREMVVRCPRVLLLSLPSQLQPWVDTLRDLGLDTHDVRRMLHTCTALLLRHNIRQVVSEKLSFLTGTCGLSPPVALRLLANQPALLTLSTLNLHRKHRFLAVQMGLSGSDVATYPQYFLRSLLVDIGPRFSYARERRLLSPLCAASPRPADDPATASDAGQGGTQGPGSTLLPHHAAPRLQLQRLLEGDVPHFVAMIGGDLDDYHMHSTHWLQAEGLEWGIGSENDSW